MNNIYALNKEFKEQQILSHDELNLIVTKINEIIAFIAPLNKDSETDPQDDSQNEGITKSIDELIQEAISGLVADVDRLKNTPSGQVVTEQMWAQYRDKTDQAMQKVSAIEMAFNGINLTSLAANIQAAETLVSQLSISPEKINLIVSMIDDDNHLIIDPAQIIAAITKDGESGELISSIKISADQVELSGSTFNVKTKLTDIEGQLSALYAEFQKVEVKDTLTSVHIKGGDINIGNGAFVVDSNGHVTANDIIMSGQGHWITMEEYSSVTLPEPRQGSSVVVFNRVPTASGILQGEPHYRTIDVNSGVIRVWTQENGGKWSNQGSSLISWISSRIVFAKFVSDGKDWYMIDYKLCDGQTI